MLSVYEIGEKIAIARKLKNLSQAQLAEQLSISAQAVGKWERGESMPDIITFQHIAEALGVDMNYFSSSNEAVSVPGNSAQSNSPEGRDNTSRKTDWNMSGGNWTDADFSGLSGLAEKFNGSNIERCQFVNSELSGLTLKSNNITDSDFSKSDFSGCRLVTTNLAKNVFADCDFTDGELNKTNVRNCDFSRANLTGLTAVMSNVRNVNLDGAVLRNTSFKMGQFTDIIFTGEITDCTFVNNDFTRVEFVGATLRNTFFKNCKLKHAKFTNCNADKLTIAFLKICKADLTDVNVTDE